MDIQAIVEKLDVIETVGQLTNDLTGVTQDSRLIEPGFIFAARSGERSRGLDFLDQAIENGASLVMTADPLPSHPPLPTIRVKEFYPALIKLSHSIYGDPSRKLKLIGITGTKGKSTSTYYVQSILSAAGERCGLIGTIGYDTGTRKINAPLTTPEIDRLCGLWAEMVRSGCGWAVMEVSSHALSLGRIERTHFNAAAYTNLSHEHLDFHKTMDNYFEAKAKLFRMLSSDATAVININDRWGRRMMKAASGHRIITYGKSGTDADLTVTSLEQTLLGSGFLLTWRERDYEIWTSLIGTYQAENIALAAGVTLGLGIKIDAVIDGIANLKAVPGRMESVVRGQPFFVFVDYAHAPDPLEQALESIRPLCRGRMTVVFGCGGDRDKEKRPQMGRIAAELADRIIITKDNSRTEKPSNIMDMILNGVPKNLRNKVTVEIDRRKAIHQVVREAENDDVILILGKGHETYQEEHGVRHPFDDRLVAVEALAELGWN